MSDVRRRPEGRFFVGMFFGVAGWVGSAGGNGECGKWRSGYYANQRHRVPGGWLARLRSFVDFMASLHNFRFQAGGRRYEERHARQRRMVGGGPGAEYRRDAERELLPSC